VCDLIVVHSRKVTLVSGGVSRHRDHRRNLLLRGFILR
jgi:hypothetical protein